MTTVGQQFGKLTVLSIEDKHALCRCFCGQERSLLISRLVQGFNKSCGCLRNPALGLAQKNRTYQFKYSPEITSARYVYASYKDGNLSFDQFYELSQQPCYLCGISKSRVTNRITKSKTDDNHKLQGDFYYNGLDRLDSKKKHDFENVRSCCFICNRMKLNRGLDDFLKWVKQIVLFKNTVKKDNQVGFDLLKKFAEYAEENELKGKRKFHPQQASAVKICRDVYKNELSFPAFINLTQQNCFYCDIQPSNKINTYTRKNNSQWAKDNGWFIYNGLDRITCDLGHTIDNVVACCKFCNIAKNTLSQTDFYNKIEQIYYQQFGNNTKT
jgi:hypothetical protein